MGDDEVFVRRSRREQHRVGRQAAGRIVAVEMPGIEPGSGLGDTMFGVLIEGAGGRIEIVQGVQRPRDDLTGSDGADVGRLRQVATGQGGHQQPVAIGVSRGVDDFRTGDAGVAEPAQPLDLTGQLRQRVDWLGLEKEDVANTIDLRAGFADRLEQHGVAGEMLSPAGRRFEGIAVLLGDTPAGPFDMGVDRFIDVTETDAGRGRDDPSAVDGVEVDGNLLVVGIAEAGDVALKAVDFGEVRVGA